MIALDTNILVYASEEGEKAAFARDIMLRAGLTGAVLPVQVLLEFANVCRRKTLLSPQDARQRISDYAALFTIVPTSLEHLDAGIQLSGRYQLAFFDALICAVAQAAGANILLSEDMSDGSRYEGLQIINPFKAGNRSTLDRLLPA